MKASRLCVRQERGEMLELKRREVEGLVTVGKGQRVEGLGKGELAVLRIVVYTFKKRSEGCWD